MRKRGRTPVTNGPYGSHRCRHPSYLIRFQLFESRCKGSGLNMRGATNVLPY